MSEELFTPRAARELVEAVTTLARDNQNASIAVLAATMDAARLLAKRPHLGRTDQNLPEKYRFWSLTRYSYVMVYDASVTPIRILRILHTARDVRTILKPLADQ